MASSRCGPWSITHSPSPWPFGEKFLAAPFLLFTSQVINVLPERPGVPEGTFQLPISVTPELVGQEQLPAALGEAIGDAVALYPAAGI